MRETLPPSGITLADLCGTSVANFPGDYRKRLAGIADFGETYRRGSIIDQEHGRVIDFTDGIAEAAQNRRLSGFTRLDKRSAAFGFQAQHPESTAFV